MSDGEVCDVLVIGGGPAGATAAALLSAEGRDVVVLEKDAHPRFHVGESLLPRSNAILERLGLAAQVAEIGVYKPGAEFVSDETGESAAFRFSLARRRDLSFSYQVRRSDFDALLFGNARRRGARMFERTRAVEMRGPEPDGRLSVAATAPDGARLHFAPRFVLDASGRDTFLAGRLGLKQADKRNNTGALFAHFRGAEARSGELEGFITVHLAADGWFWMIPLPDGVMSVGFVGTQVAFKGRRGSPADLFEERLRASPTVAARLSRAERISDVISAGNYSYRARTAWTEGAMMIGDAFAFVDPVFSSGVLLAMGAGEMGAKVAAAYLRSPDAGRALATRVEKRLRREMDRLNWLIYRINDPVLRRMFMAPSNRFGMRDGLVSMLAGNLRPDFRTVFPEFAFKTVYTVMSASQRLSGRAVA